jgi:ribosomal protein L11 methyltransferase
MLSLSIECDQSNKERLSAELSEAGAQGILEEDLPENRSRLEAFFEDEADASSLAERFTEYGAVVRKQEARDWVKLAQSQWLPILVGKRFFLVPEWRTDPVPPDRIRLEMPAGLAYGTGLDPTTQLALEAMERSLRLGDAVLDLGAGSGILALGAKRLGAGTVVACDIDPQAVEVAEDFFHTAGEDIPVFVGSTRSV